jgi:hypothetical protein
MDRDDDSDDWDILEVEKWDPWLGLRANNYRVGLKPDLSCINIVGSEGLLWEGEALTEPSGRLGKGLRYPVRLMRRWLMSGEEHAGAAVQYCVDGAQGWLGCP